MTKEKPVLFVTVGTHEQQFNRLLQYVDELVEEGIIQEEVVAQTGFSTYEPVHASHRSWYSPEEMERFTDEARIIICHGGPSSYMPALQREKVPIVFPRRKAYGEHVNDHQYDFSVKLAKQKKMILLAETKEELKECILHYDAAREGVQGKIPWNNDSFNKGLSLMVEEMFATKQTGGTHD